eukprot:1140750-Pelagomonas_calceolata.AAC.3
MAWQVSVCASLRAKRKAAHNLPWFDIACKEKRRVLTEAVQTGQSVHACEIVRKRYKLQVRWSKRVRTQWKKEVFLDRSYAKDPDELISILMLVEKVSLAADQPESRAVGQTLVTLVHPGCADKNSYSFQCIQDAVQKDVGPYTVQHFGS